MLLRSYIADTLECRSITGDVSTSECRKLLICISAGIASIRTANWPGLGPRHPAAGSDMNSANLVDVCGVSILDDGSNEATVWHGQSQGDIDALIVCDAVAISGAGCMQHTQGSQNSSA